MPDAPTPPGRRSRRRTRRRAAIAAVGTMLAAGSGVLLSAGPASAATTVVVIEGRGFGHGVGMAQDGAYWLGRSGRSAADILRLFFPGTALGSQAGVVRVPLLGAREVTIGFPDGGSVGDLAIPAGRSIKVRSSGGAVTASVLPGADASTRTTRTTGTTGTQRAFADRSGKVVRVELLADVVPDPTTTVLAAIPPTVAPISPVAPVSGGPVGVQSAPQVEVEPPPPTTLGVVAPEAGAPEPGAPDTAPPTTGAGDAATSRSGATLSATAADGSVVLVGGKRYRGSMVLTPGGDGVTVVNELDVEQYLRGMGEVLDPRWPPAALQAQAIAARTYALKTMATAGQVCPTQRCQVYLGAQAEYPAMDAAVKATAGKVVTYQGKLALTFYSASGGGTVADPSEVFGPTAASIPYLQPGVYPTGDLKAWTVEVSLDQLARRFGYPGTASSVAVSVVGPSGRAVEVTIDGTAGPRTVAGPAFDAALGLRSTNFTLRTDTATAPPPDLTLPATGGGDATGLDGTALAAQAALLRSTENENGTPTTTTDAVAGGVADAVAMTSTSGPTASAAPAPRTTISAPDRLRARTKAEDVAPRSSGLPGWMGQALAALSGIGVTAWCIRWALHHREHDDP